MPQAAGHARLVQHRASGLSTIQSQQLDRHGPLELRVLRKEHRALPALSQDALNLEFPELPEHSLPPLPTSARPTGYPDQVSAAALAT
jgi:hypothetical protein